MKITRFLAPLLLMCGLSARAQLAVIPIIGANESFHFSSGFNFINASLGLKAGMLVEYYAPKGLCVQSGALYSSYHYGNARVNAVEIPLTFITKFGEPSGNRFVLGIGPCVGLPVSGTAKDAYGYGSTVISLEKYAPPAYLGLNLNLGYEFLHGFYTRASIQPILSNLAVTQDVQYYVAQISFCLGYRIAFERKEKSQEPLTGK